MSHRRVVGLREVERCARPGFLPKAKLKGSNYLGILYENKVARALPQARHGLWFHFWDANGEGWCNPDLVLPSRDWIVVVEVKLTDTPRAIGQLRELYFPVLTHFFGRPVRGVVVAKNLWRKTNPELVVETIGQALLCPADQIPVVHWLGNTRLE